MKGIIAKDKKPFLTNDLSMPSAKKGEVLVQVKYTSLNPTDVDLIEGNFALLAKLLGHSGPVKSGLEFSGIVASDGVTFRKGDKVFGYIDLMGGDRAHQEFISVSENFIALMPSTLGFEESAALPLGALTAYVSIYEILKVKKGMNILVNGAAGGVGVYALQFLKNIGVNITAIDGPGKEEFLKSLGANIIFNYKEQDIKKLDSKYDVILDLTTMLKMKDIKHILAESGIFVPFDPLKNMFDILKSLFSSKKAKWLMVDKGDHEKLTKIAKLVDAGELVTFVDSAFELSDYLNAFERLSKRGKVGRTVMKMS